MQFEVWEHKDLETIFTASKSKIFHTNANRLRLVKRFYNFKSYDLSLSAFIAELNIKKKL